MNLVGPSRNIDCFIHFLFVGDFSFIRGCRKHELHTFRIDIACFYYIVLQDRKLLGIPIKIYEFVLPCIC